MEDITTPQFESLITQRVILRCLATSKNAVEKGFARNDLIFKAVSVANEVLKENGLGDKCFCQLRGLKIFLFHQENQRIIAELSLACDTDPATGYRKRPQFFLMSRKGFIKTQPLSQLVKSVGKLKKYERTKNAQDTHSRPR